MLLAAVTLAAAPALFAGDAVRAAGRSLVFIAILMRNEIALR
jgi:hypothetical protein